MGFLGGFLRRVAQTDEERLSDEVHDWADSITDTTRVAECPERTQVRVAGVVRRLTLRPVAGQESLSVVVHDGTGEVTALWTGRDEITGLRLGTRLLLEGLIAREGDELRMVNPRFEFV